MKTKIENLLRDTRRDGMEELLKYMEVCGFYTAPCSTQYHLAKDGGLAEHSMNVFVIMSGLAKLLYPEIPYDSIIICSLLHDLGKTGQFGKAFYVPNFTKPRATKANPNPEPVRSDKKPFESNSDLLYVDHEIRSIQIISKYIELTEDENWAILMHNGMYGPYKYQIQGKETPLYLLLHMADMWAARVVEKDEVQEDA